MFPNWAHFSVLLEPYKRISHIRLSIGLHYKLSQVINLFHFAVSRTSQLEEPFSWHYWSFRHGVFVPLISAQPMHGPFPLPPLHTRCANYPGVSNDCIHLYASSLVLVSSPPRDSPHSNGVTRLFKTSLALRLSGEKNCAALYREYTN